MQHNFIYFKKERSLGDILNDTFKFIRYEWKSLMGMVLKMAGPALVIMIAAFVIYQQSIFSTVGTYDFDPTQTGIFSATVIGSVLLMIVAAVAYFGLLYSTVLNYIKSYVDNNGVVNKDEVKSQVWKTFGSMLGLIILNSIIFVFAFILCVIPIFYVGTVLGTSYAIVVFQRRDVMDTISYSFNFVNKEFWITFATYIVLYIIYYFISGIFQIPMYIYTFGKMFTSLESFTGDITDMYDWVSTLLNAIAMIAQYLSQTIIAIGSAFIYFNLNERLHHTGTIEAIDSIGNGSSLDA